MRRATPASSWVPCCGKRITSFRRGNDGAPQGRAINGRYLTLNASRQTGKTTLFQEMIEALEAEGAYFGLLLDFEALTGFERVDFYEQLANQLEEWRLIAAPTAPTPPSMRHHADFAHWLRKTVAHAKRRCVLIIDEFDAISQEIVVPNKPLRRLI